MGHFAKLVDLLRWLIAVAIWSQDAVDNAEQSGRSARENFTLSSETASI